MGNVLKRTLELTSYVAIFIGIVSYSLSVIPIAVTIGFLLNPINYIITGKWGFDMKVFEYVYDRIPNYLSQKIIEPYFDWLQK